MKPETKPEIIKALKENEKPLILMDGDLRVAMIAMDHAEFICLQNTSTLNDPLWKRVVADSWYVTDNLYNVFKLRPDYESESEIVECEIRRGAMGDLRFDYSWESNTDESCSIKKNWSVSKACDIPDFTGFKFEDGNVGASRVMYSVKGQTSRGYFAPLGALKNGTAHTHHATHVVFRVG